MMKISSYEANKRRSRRVAKRCASHLSDRLNKQEAAITISDPAAMVDLAREAPVLVAREAQIAMKTLYTGFNQHRGAIIGAAYAAAYHMVRTDRAWEEFIKDPGWGDLSNKPKNTFRARNNMLMHVMRYVFGAEGNAARRRVRVYAGMLQDRYNKGFKPEDVIPLINKVGIEALRKEGVARRKAARGLEDDNYLDDLNAIADGDPPYIPTLTKRQWRKLTPAQVGERISLLDNFNGAMLRYLADRARTAPCRIASI